MTKLIRARGLAVLIVLAALLPAAPNALAETAEAQAAAAIDTAGEPIDVAAEGTTPSPVPTIERFHAGLLEIMKNAETLGFEGRVDELAPLMARTFDLDFMASKTVGRHWKQLTDEEREKWTRTFARFTTANYAGRFKGFKGEEFITLGEEDAAKGTRVVLTKIVVPDDEDVQLNYRVIERDGQWRVIDVYLNGTVSELALRRSEYSSALKREGFEHLVASIETKIEDLKTKGNADG